MTKKVVLTMFVSLDGYVEGPNKEFVPPAWSGDLERHWSGANIDRAETLLYGRVNFEGNARFWRGVEADPSSPPELVQFAHRINSMPKVVFSRTWDVGDPGWNGRVVNADIAAEVAALKQTPGKDLVLLGGADIASTFMRLGLIDEFRLLVMPIVLGGGTPLFQGGYDRFGLELLETTPLDTGSIILRYGRTYEHLPV